MSNTAWPAIFQTLSPLLEKNQRNRLAKETAGRRLARRDALRDRYQDFVNNELGLDRGGPRTNTQFPSSWDFMESPEIETILDDDSLSGVSDETWASVLPAIRIWARSYRWERLRVLTDILDGVAIPECGYDVPDLEELLAADEQMSARLALATSIFLCTGCGVPHVYSAFEPANSGGETCLGLATSTLVANNLRIGPSTLMASICRDLGLDPQTATSRQVVADIEETDKMWLCQRCDDQHPQYYCDLQGFVSHCVPFPNLNADGQ